MKILHVIGSMNPALGGVCQAVRTMVRGLAEGGGVVSVVVSLDPPDADFAGKDDFELHLLGPAALSWGYSKRLLPWLKEHLEDV